VCGLVLAQSILAALHHRARHGQGQHVEVPMLDTVLSFNLIEHVGLQRRERGAVQGWGFKVRGGKTPRLPATHEIT
jgi:crotonobetainyl-CoA:carnitine CoA-transferase CaiB-like acyl-CoA transferase